jgi:dinuclear metal center YbgI/SA1388 family protein
VTTVGDIAAALEQLAPARLAEPWDNVGLQVGKAADLVERALLVLDVDDQVLREAVAGGYGLVIAHHPLLFGEVKSIVDATAAGRAVIQALAAGVSIYVSHTNLDRAQGGLNDALADLMSLNDIAVLEPAVGHEVHGLGRVGTLAEPWRLQEFIEACQQWFTADLRIVGEVDIVEKVAVCAGSGASLIDHAHAAGAAVFITGDLRYHEAQRALELGLTVIDAGHDATERAGLRAWLRRVRSVLPVPVDEAQERGPLWRRLSEHSS